MSQPHFATDILIIGGGTLAVGVPATRPHGVSRSLSVTLIEKSDMGAASPGTSSKLSHGGLRYLEDFVFLQGPARPA